jgi:mediator of RNA polymerase II transcription subunit 7
MADAQRALTAPFPPPPPFWKHFTTENIDKLEKIKKESATSEGSTGKKWTASDLQALNVPTELRYLIPPDAPKEGTYSVFGELQNVRTCYLSTLADLL